MRPDPKILAFDTSAAHCAAALLFGGRVLTRVDEMSRGQAEHLMPMLEDMMAESDLGWRDLDALGVGTGPGNFTGIRIAVSAARGLALGLKIPTVGVSNLEAQVYDVDGSVISCLPAPRGQIYAQGFGAAAFAPRVIALDDPADIAVLQAADAPLCGLTAKDIAEKLNMRYVSATVNTCVGIAKLTELRMEAKTERPKPLYLRPADAAPAKNAAPVLLP